MRKNCCASSLGGMSTGGVLGALSYGRGHGGHGGGGHHGHGHGHGGRGRRFGRGGYYASGGYGPGYYYDDAGEICIWDQASGRLQCLPTSGYGPSTIVLGAGRATASLNPPALHGWSGAQSYGADVLPSLPTADERGEVCVWDPRTGTICRMIPLSEMAPSGPGGTGESALMQRAAFVPPKGKAGWSSPGGFVAAPIGNATSYLPAYGALDPTEVLQAKSSADSGTAASQQLSETLAALSPAISTVVESITDPVKRVAVLKAKIANAKASGASASRIRILQAKLDAAQTRVGVKEESLQSTRDWRSLGKVGLVTGIAIGGAVILFILAKAFKR